MIRSRRTRRTRWAALALTLATTASTALVAHPASAEGGPPPAPTCTPATTPNGRYVQSIYVNILFRCPDPGGQTHWTGLLDGGMARAEFTRLVDMSDENIGKNNVDELYTQALGRAPSPAERAGAMENLRAGSSDAVLISVLLASDEFYNSSHLTDEAWVGVAYDHILDRAPDPQGKAHFLSQFSNGGSTYVQRLLAALEMERSTENAQSWVTEIYGGAVHRGPSGPELALQIAWLEGPGHWQTFRLWTNMLATNEAFAIGSAVPPTK